MLRDFIAPRHTSWFPYRHEVAKQLLSILKPGDVFVRKGNHTVAHIIPFSGFVEWLTNSPYSHATLVYEVTDTDVLLAEVSDYGMRRIYLIDWLDEVNGPDFQVLRYNGFPPLVTNKLIKQARKYIAADMPYNTALDYEQDNTLYCVQFIYKCFESASVQLAPGKSLKEMPRWNYFLRILARILRYDTDKPMYFVGNEKMGMLSSDTLFTLAHVKLEEIKHWKRNCVRTKHNPITVVKK
jgi:hypothetical protein